MFCSICGVNVIEGASFCHKCGFSVSSSSRSAASNTSPNIQQDTRPTAVASHIQTTCARPIMTFHDFKSVKEKDRQGHFKNKASKKRKTDNNTEKLVTIKIGMITYRKDTGTLKPVRGSQLAVSVSPSSNSREVRAKAVEKQSRFNQSISKFPDVYYLLYPDLTQVVNLPGTDEEFTLERYKKELGKAYERITLYLCTATDHLANDGIFLDSDSDGGLDIVEQREVGKILTTRQLGFFQATPLWAWGRLFES